MQNLKKLFNINSNNIMEPKNINENKKEADLINWDDTVPFKIGRAHV